MTPKEKAEEIYRKYWVYFTTEKSVNSIFKHAKQCALIAVDEMIKQYKKITVPHLISCYKTQEDFNNNFEYVQRQLDYNVINNIWYWQQVKQEIELL